MVPSRLDAYQLLHDGILAFSRAEAVGIKIDVDRCRSEIDRLSELIVDLELRLKKTKLGRLWKHVYNTKTNYNSDYQLANLLYNKLKLEPIAYTVGGNPSVDKNSLSKLQNKVPGVSEVINLRKWKKARDTYLEGILREQVDGVLHPFFELHTARTYRSSSSHVNFQNQPKRDKEVMRVVRSVIIPRPGHILVEVDYGSLEVRISTCYHKDPTMITYIEDPTTDLHRDMCQQIYILADDEWTKETRFYAKNGFVFPEFYGDYYRNCAYAMWEAISEFKLKTAKGVPLKKHLRNKGIRNYQQFEDHMQDVEEHFWGERFPVYAEWKEKWREEYQKKGYIDLLTGFRCSGVMGKNDVINYPVQGAAFHCLLWSFIQLDKELRNWNTNLIGQIHDSIVFDCDPDEFDNLVRLVHDVMCCRIREHWDWIIVPLEIEVDATGVDKPWSEKKGVDISGIIS
ncbi:MAG TPA: hypothetical protein ENF41_01135 [Candidatus Bathyarchaeota archaeon]|nr:hypothetical protein [Candidatus Bathyarchaeota archaeon]